MEEDLELTPHSIGGMAETYRQQMLTKETENHQLIMIFLMMRLE